MRHDLSRKARLVLAAGAVWLLGAAAASAQAPAPAPWWNPAFTFRQQITVSAGTTVAPAGYLVFYTFNHASLVAGGKSLANGGDLRVVFWDGAANVEIDRALAAGSSFNNVATRIAFKTQAPIAALGTDLNYYVYYGNAAPGAPPTAVPSSRLFQVESLAVQTRANNVAYQQVATLTFTPGAANEVWLYFATFDVKSNVGQAPSDSTLEARTTLNGAQDIEVEQQDNEGDHYKAMIIAGRITGVAAAQTIGVDIKSLQANTTTSIKNIRIVAALLPPGADFNFASNDALQNLTSAFGDVANPQLTFTPAGAGDYYIIAAGQHAEDPNGGVASSSLRFTIDNAATFWPQGNDICFDDQGVPAPCNPIWSSNPRAALDTFFVMRKVTLPAAAQTFKFQFQSSNGGAPPDFSDVKGLRIFAFRADAFDAVEDVENLADSSTTSATPVVKSTLTTAVPPAARDYLVVQSQYVYDFSLFAQPATHQELADFRRGAVVLSDQDHTMDNPTFTFASACVHALNTAVAQTYENRFWSNSALETRSKESVIHALRGKEPLLSANGCEATQAGVAGPITVVPAGGFASTGPRGGPFAPPSMTYTVSNPGTAPMDWTAAAGQPWVVVAPTNGTLAAGASIDVVVSFNLVATNCLGAGSHSDTVTFTNVTNNCGNTTRPVDVTVTGAASGPLTVDPPGGLTSSGDPGGPFSPTSITYTLTNSGTVDLCWSARTLQTWTALSAAVGVLAPGASTMVTVSLAAAANALGPGVYSDTVIFTNTDGGAGSTTRPVLLTVNGSGDMTVSPTAPLASAGAVGGPFNPTSITYTITNTGTGSLNWTAAATQPWVAVFPAAGTLAAGASATVTVSLVSAAANTLAAGVYTDTVTFTNTTNGSGNTLRSVTLSVSTDPPPTITITFPSQDPFTTTLASVTVQGTAADNISVTTVTWSNALTGDSGVASGTTSWSMSITLAPGSNFITVVAFDNSGNSSTASITIIYTPVGGVPGGGGGGGGEVWGGCWASRHAPLSYDHAHVLVLVLALVHALMRAPVLRRLSRGVYER